MVQTPPQMANLVCPNCRQQFTTQVHTIIDVGQDPEAKLQLLQGRMNVAICPRCGASGPLNTPFLYHDPQKELLFVYSPPPTAMSNDQQQRFIGSLINTVMSSLPPEQRKGYLFQPRTFLSKETLQDEIIIADGVPRQQLESQKRKLSLLDRFLAATSDDVIEVIAKENEKDLDYGFFLLLNSIIGQATSHGNEAEVSRLQALRRKLLQYSEAARQGDIESAQMVSQDELLRRLVESDDEQQQKALVSLARPLLDYAFFQALTNLLEEAERAENSEEAHKLRDLRSKLLEWTAELDAEARKIWQHKARLIQEILQSPDWRAALEPQWQEIDYIFLTILSSNIQLAREQRDDQAATTLQQLADLAMVIAQEKAPPEVKLLNLLLEADYPQDTQRILEENQDRVDARFVGLIDTVIQDLVAQGREQDIKIIQQIRSQAEAIINNEKT